MEQQPKVKNSRQFSILTLNIHGYPARGLATLSKRCDLLRNVLADCKTTVVCLQEVHTYGQLHTILRKLPHKSYTYSRGIRGPAGGLVVLSQVYLSTCYYISFPKLTHEESALYSLKGKIFTSGSGMLITTLPYCNLVNVHLAPNKDGQWTLPNKYATLQRKQLTFINQWIKQYDVNTNPTFIAGDFNVPGDSDIFRESLLDASIQDVESASILPTFKQEFLKGNAIARRVDSILYKYSRTLVTTSAHLFDQVPVSDHVGVRASVQLPDRDV